MTYVAPFTGGIVQPSNVSYRSVSISANYAPVWPSKAADTPEVVADIMAVAATVGALTITLPPADEVGVGSPSVWRTIGANAFTLVDQSGNTILNIPAGEVWFVYITDNSTPNGVWATFQYSATTSQATPGPLAGLGLIAITTTLNLAHPVVTTATSGYAISASDRAEVLAWTGGVGTINLPASGTAGNNFFLLLRNAGTGVLTGTPSGGDLIDDNASLTLNPTESCFIICSGTGWVTVGQGRSITITTTQAIVDVSGSVDVTLTTADAGNTLIQLIGALTGSINVIVPTNVASYHFTNNTTGAFQITIKTAAGTGVVLPQGTRAVLDCDGTNVVNANSAFIAGTFITITTKAALFSTSATDRGVLFRITGGAPFTVTLLSAITATNGYFNIFRNESAGDITLSPAVGNIGGAATLVLRPGDCVYAVSDGADYQIIWDSPMRRVQVFTINGTFTPPAGVWLADVAVWGGGGSGGGGAGVNNPGTGGGGGEYRRGFVAVSPGVGVTVTVATAAAAVAFGTPGNNGSASSFGASIVCNGGAGGPLSAANRAGGAGGVGGSGGSEDVAGGSGGADYSFSAPGVFTGYGGGSFGTPPQMQNATVGGISPGGGGCGGPAAAGNSGAGAVGRVVVRY